MVNSIVLANWFQRGRGTAIGIAAAGIGVGTMVGVPALQRIIEVAGWRTAYLCIGAVVLLVIPPIALKFHRHRPEDMGLLPDGGPAKQKASDAGRPRALTRVVDKAWAERAWDVRSAVRTRRFWLLFATLLLAPLAHQGVMVHQVAYLVDRGLDPMLGASLVGLVGISGSAGKILWGWISDRIGREGAYSLGMLCIIAGVVLLSGLSDVAQTWRLYAYAVIFGMGYGTSAPLNPAIVADIFQGKRFGSIYGVIYIGAGSGAAFGPWASGLIFDLTRSYDLAFVLASLAAALSMVCVWLAAPRKVRQVPGVAARIRASEPERVGQPSG
jgi:MFS family permease